MQTTELIRSTSIEALLARRNAVSSRVEEIVGLFGEIGEIAQADDSGLSQAAVLVESHRFRDRFSHESYMREVDRSAWQLLMVRSGLWAMLDAKARAEWQQLYDTYGFPPLTADNIRATFESIHHKRGDYFARGVHELFFRLSRNHKTNEPGRWTQKVIVEHAVTVWGSGAGRLYSPHTSFTNSLDDLNRVLHVLRGLAVPDNQTISGHRSCTRATSDGSFEFEWSFLHVRMFKKGTAHLTFRYEEDVARLNKVMDLYTDGAALPPPDRR